MVGKLGGVGADERIEAFGFCGTVVGAGGRVIVERGGRENVFDIMGEGSLILGSAGFRIRILSDPGGYFGAARTDVWLCTSRFCSLIRFELMVWIGGESGMSNFVAEGPAPRSRLPLGTSVTSELG